MNALRQLARVSVLLVVAVFPYLPEAGHAAGMDGLLPEPHCAEGWSLEERPVFHTPDTLYERINGESELFFPYGFEMLAYGRYVNKKDPKAAIDADIYRMGSLLDSFGIFSTYRKSDASDPKIGAEGFAIPSQLLFYQDRYFVRLQVTGTLNPEQEGLIACAKAISGKLPRNLSQPGELEPFRLAAVVRGSERYIPQGLLGYAFLGRGIVADAAMGEEQFRVFIVTGDSPEAAGRALDLYHAYLRENGNDVSMKEEHGRMVLSGSDPLYKKILVVREGRYLVGAVRFNILAIADEMVKSFLRRLGPAARD